MGNATTLTLEPGKYLFAYNSITHVTTYMKFENEAEYRFINPRIYGEFNSWAIEGEDALVLRDIDQDGKYVIELEFSEEVTSDFGVLYSKMFYEGEGYAVWGAGEQYKFNGKAAGMGGVTTLTLEPGRYLFVHDTMTKITTYTKMVQGATYEFPLPRLYGEFNTWAFKGEGAQYFSEKDQDGVHFLELEVEKALTSDFTVMLTQMYYVGEGYATWGAGEQYKLDGEAAGMGNASSLTLEPGKYLFAYNSITHVTTHIKIQNGAEYRFINPRIYGEFNVWAIEGGNAICFEAIDENGKYTLEIEITSTITSDFTIVVSKMFYEGEGYAVWGAGEQYKPDGTAAGMGEAMILTLEPGVYIFTYDPDTHITTYVKEA